MFDNGGGAMELGRKLSDIVLAEYDLGELNEIDIIQCGRSDCYVYHTNKGSYFVKYLPEKYKREDCEQELTFINHLTARGIPTSEFIKAKNGEFFISDDNRYITVQKYIEGKMYKKFEAPDWLKGEASRLLGTIHIELKDFEITERSLTEAHFSEERKLMKINNYQKRIERVFGSRLKYASQMIADFSWKIERLKEFDLSLFSLCDFQYGNTHGDYNTLQLLCGDHEIKAVIDFTDSCNMPIAWEVIRSFTYFERLCKDGEFAVDEYIEYLSEYLKVNKLQNYDLKHVHRLYYAQILFSEFGYKNYLEGDGTNIEMLQFGFWRTKMCRSLHDKMAIIDGKIEEFITSRSKVNSKITDELF